MLARVAGDQGSRALGASGGLCYHVGFRVLQGFHRDLYNKPSVVYNIK